MIMPRLKLNNTTTCLLIFILFFILSFWFTKAPITHLDSMAPQGGDPFLVTWIWSWEMHQLPINPLTVFDANIFAPFKNTLAFTEHMFGSLLLAWPLFLIFKNIVLVYNLICHLTFAIGGLGMYLLAYYLTKNRAASFIAAFIYAFAPYKINHLEHINLSGLWLPYFLLYTQKMFARFSWPNALLFLGFSLLVFLNAMQYFLFLPFVFIFLAIAHWQSDSWALLKRNWFKITVIFLIFSAVVVIFTKPYFEIRQEFGLERAINNIEGLSPDLIDYFISPFFYRIFYPAFFPEWAIGPGIFVWLLLITSLVFLFRRHAIDRRLVAYSTFGLLALLCSLGYYLQFTRAETSGLFGPWAIFYHLLPGFGSIRAVGRYSIFFLLAASIIIALGLKEFFLIKQKNNLPKIFITSVALFILLFVEFSFTTPKSYKSLLPAPAVCSWLKDQPPSQTYLELPSGVSLLENNWDAIYEYWSISHFQKMINGYSGYSPRVHQELNKRLLDFDLDISDLQAAKDYGATRLIFHFGFYPPAFKEKIIHLLPSGDFANLIYQSENDYVYQIK